MLRYSLSRMTEMKCMKSTVTPKGVGVPWGLLAETVKAHTSLAHRHHA